MWICWNWRSHFLKMIFYHGSLQDCLITLHLWQEDRTKEHWSYCFFPLLLLEEEFTMKHPWVRGLHDYATSTNKNKWAIKLANHELGLGTRQVIKLIPSSNWTMAQQGSKQTELVIKCRSLQSFVALSFSDFLSLLLFTLKGTWHLPIGWRWRIEEHVKELQKSRIGPSDITSSKVEYAVLCTNTVRMIYGTSFYQ